MLELEAQEQQQRQCASGKDVDRNLHRADLPMAQKPGAKDIEIDPSIIGDPQRDPGTVPINHRFDGNNVSSAP